MVSVHRRLIAPAFWSAAVRAAGSVKCRTAIERGGPRLHLGMRKGGSCDRGAFVSFDTDVLPRTGPVFRRGLFLGREVEAAKSMTLTDQQRRALPVLADMGPDRRTLDGQSQEAGGSAEAGKRRRWRVWLGKIRRLPVLNRSLLRKLPGMSELRQSHR